MKPKTIVLVLVILTGLNIFLALNRHSRSDPYSYHGELWADRAGYFMYLPAATSFGFDARRFPPGLDTLTGHGFTLDTLTGKILTKYTSGVALLQAPFYLAGHGLARVMGISAGHYGPVDRIIVDVATPVLLSLGLLFLFMLLRSRHGDRLTAWTLLGIYAGSNLFYYTIGDPGMSHVYSFFLFALLLLLLDQYFRGAERTWLLFLIGLVAGWIVLVRPTNLVFLLAAPFVCAEEIRAGWRRLMVLRPAAYLLLMAGAFLVWIPQLLYWRYAFGSAVTWPYVNEGFTNWASPELLKFWFAPNNGLFSYTPLYLLVPLSAAGLWHARDRITAVVAVFAMVITSYLGASWWVWHFGCGFGGRIMVEYLALFAVPLTALSDTASRRWGRWLPIAVFGMLAGYNLKLVYSFGDCWFHEVWDWHAFGQLVFGPTK